MLAQFQKCDYISIHVMFLSFNKQVRIDLKDTEISIWLTEWQIIFLDVID